MLMFETRKQLSQGLAKVYEHEGFFGMTDIQIFYDMEYV